MQFENLLLEIKNKIALVTINRPDKLNALNTATMKELQEAFIHLKEDDAVNSIIITGAGNKAFVAGADIKELNQLDVISGRKFSEEGQKVFNEIESSTKPVIAAVNGYALGGGCELALACHIRLAADNAVFGQPEVNLGVIPGYGGTQRLARLVNTGRAMEIILTGDMVDAKEAYRLGIANKVFEQKDLLDEAKKMAMKINEKGQVSVKMAVKSVVACDELSEQEGLKLEAGLFAVCCGSNDFKEGTKAFLEKRKPNFKGN